MNQFISPSLSLSHLEHGARTEACLGPRTQRSEAGADRDLNEKHMDELWVTGEESGEMTF